MSRLFTSILFLLAAASARAQSITWGTPVTVATGAGNNLHPRIALNRSGDPYVLWGKSDAKAYFSKWNGSGFTMPVVPSGSFTVFTQTWAGPDLAAFGDTVYVTMKVTPEMTATNYAYLAHSYNGGNTFSMPVRIDNIGADISRFPTVATTATGNPVVSFMRFDAGTMANARYVVAGSADFGNTFTADAPANSPANPVCDCCPASLISGGGKTVVLYRDNATNIRDIWAGISTDGGATFPNRLRVDTSNWNFNSCPSSGPDAFVLGDSLYTVFMSTASGSALVNFGRASFSGMTASHSRITGKFTGLSSQNFPRIAHAGPAAIAVWKQNATTGSGVAYAFTNDISKGLSGYTMIAGAAGSGVMNTDVAMAPGAVHVVWQDDNTGKLMYIKGTYTIPSSITAISNKELIRVFPNPANDQFTVAFDKTDQIGPCYLVDNAGRKTELKPVIASGRVTFPLQGVAKGSYYFIMNTSTGNGYYSQIIVQ